MNCDGGIGNHSEMTGCGSVLHNHKGEFIFAFSHRLQHVSTTEARVWAIYHDLGIAWGKRFRKLLVESDSVLAINFLYENDVYKLNYTHIYKFKILLLN